MPQAGAALIGFRSSVRTPKARWATKRMPGVEPARRVAVAGELGVEQLDPGRRTGCRRRAHLDLGVAGGLHQQGRGAEQVAEPADPVGCVALGLGPGEGRPHVPRLHWRPIESQAGRSAAAVAAEGRTGGCHTPASRAAGRSRPSRPTMRPCRARARSAGDAFRSGSTSLEGSARRPSASTTPGRRG